jgi:cell division transport system permease protein
VSEAQARPRPLERQAALVVEPSGAAPIVPGESIAGRALAFTLATLCFLACLALALVLSAHRTAERWSESIAREMTVQLRPVEGAEMHAAVARALEILTATPGVVRAEAIVQTEMHALLEPWLGSALDLGELPVPQMIAVEVDARSPPDLAALEQTLAREVPGASLDDHRIWRDRLSGGARIVVGIGIFLFVLVLGVMTACAVFATRSAMAANREIVDVLYFVGARESFIAREFQRHFLILGLKAGVAGGLAAVAGLLLAGLAIDRWLSGTRGEGTELLISGIGLDPAAFVGVASIVVLVALLTALTSRVTVHHYLDERG